MTVVNVETGTINYHIHPAADIFPLIDGADFDALVEDIRTNGQMEPVVLDATGSLIDGRNRARACQVLGIDVQETRYSGDDVAAFVVSHNLHRRHLTDSQRAMVAARLANLEPGYHGNQHSGSLHMESPTRSQVKEMLNVSEGSMHRAKVIERHGTPELVALTTEGKVPLASAARVAEAEPEDQRKFVEAVKGGTEPTKASVGIASKSQAKTRPLARKSRAVKADLLEDLAAQGYSSRQMCKALGFSRDDSVRELAREFGIEIPADRSIGRTRRVNSTEIVAQTVTALDGLVMGIDLIDYDAISTEEADQWIDSLNHSIRALNRFHKKIKESIQ